MSSHFEIVYDTPTQQRTQEFSTIEQAEEWAEYITTAPISRVHNATLWSTDRQVIRHYSRPEET